MDWPKSQSIKSLAVKPDDEVFRILAATVYLGLSQLDKALFHWDYLLRINENNHQVRTDKAVALLAHGLKNEALSELNFVISQDNRNVKAIFYKALTLFESEINKPEAIQLLTALKSGNHAYATKAEELLLKYEF